MKNTKPVDIVLNTFAALIPLVQIAFLIFFSCKLINVRIEDIQNAGDASYFGGYGYRLFAGGLLLLFVNLGAFFMTVIGFLISKLNKHCKDNPKHQRRYKFLMLAPPINQILFGVVAAIAYNIIR
ncbi:MAG: hypothetical protein GX303_03605 [Clostridiales bacterium]|nr:hypothetical protein [Clostridiales bacterium]